MSGVLTLAEELVVNLEAQARPMTCGELFALRDQARDTTQVAQALRPLFDAGRIQRVEAPPGTGGGARYIYGAVGIQMPQQTLVAAAKPAPAADTPRFRDPAQFPDRPAAQPVARPAPVTEKKERGARKPLKPHKAAALAEPIRTQPVQKLQAPAAMPEGFRCAIWCDGQLTIKKRFAEMILDAAETRALIKYLDQVLRLEK